MKLLGGVSNFGRSDQSCREHQKPLECKARNEPNFIKPVVLLRNLAWLWGARTFPPVARAGRPGLWCSHAQGMLPTRQSLGGESRSSGLSTSQEYRD